MISVKNLDYTYPDAAERAIQKINFEVKPSEIFGFLGPSGAGKSTTQKVLTGVLKNYSGSVQLKGREISKIDNRFYENIGVAFEFPNLYLRFTALENLKLFASFYTCQKYEPEYLLDRVGLLPDKDLKVEAYSKGMRMRLNFIRSILHQPSLLFLDEPTSGLDPTNARLIKDMISDLREQGTTVFLTTHHMADADELCDRIAFMVDGELPVIESPEKLKLEHGRKAVKVKYIENNTEVIKEFSLNQIGRNEQFLSVLRSNEIETIHTQEATLEDIFIQVTGKKLV